MASESTLLDEKLIQSAQSIVDLARAKSVESHILNDSLDKISLTSASNSAATVKSQNISDERMRKIQMEVAKSRRYARLSRVNFFQVTNFDKSNYS